MSFIASPLPFVTVLCKDIHVAALLHMDMYVGTSIRATFSFLHSPMLAKLLVRIAVEMEKLVSRTLYSSSPTVTLSKRPGPQLQESRGNDNMYIPTHRSTFLTLTALLIPVSFLAVCSMG